MEYYAVLGLLLVSAAARGAEGSRLSRLLSNQSRNGSAAKISSVLADAVADFERRAMPAKPRPFVRSDHSGRLHVRVQATSWSSDVRVALERAGMDIEIVNEKLGVARGWIPAERIYEVARLAEVSRVTPPDYALPRVGSVTGEHVAALRCDAVRRELAVDGRRARVGVISDGIGGLLEAQATGDAPPVEVHCHGGEGEEGTAMIELIHDCAPGAAIGFCGPLDDLEMIECVECLREAFRADIIVDDLGFAAQPFFEDGPVSLAVSDAVSAGAVYVSAAGNEAQNHYQSRYRRCGAGVRHEFMQSDCTLNFAFRGDALLVLQWNEPFGAAASNYDLCVPGLGCSEDIQDGDDDPIEAVLISCSGIPTCPAELEIYKRSGRDAELEVFFHPLRASGVDLLEHRVLADSIAGHPCVEGVIATAAIYAGEPGLDLIEPFSSRGPCTIQFPAFVQRHKPDLAGIDGVQHSRPGSFPSPFFGTSAAAPGIAALAALLLDLDPALPPSGVRGALLATAFDVDGDGPDLISGFGRADAFAAALAVLPTGPRTDTPTPTATASPSPTPGPCHGDCDLDGRVTVNELITGVGISLGSSPLTVCPFFDSDGNLSVTVNELIQAVNAALHTCIPLAEGVRGKD